MRVVVVTWLMHVGLSVSAWQKRCISKKCSEMRVLRFPKSGPSVKMRFGFRTSFRLKWAKKALVQEEKKKRRERELSVQSWCSYRKPKFGRNRCWLGKRVSEQRFVEMEILAEDIIDKLAWKLLNFKAEWGKADLLGQTCLRSDGLCIRSKT